MSPSFPFWFSFRLGWVWGGFWLGCLEDREAGELGCLWMLGERICADECSAKALKLLTKGDNNAADDTELYARGQSYLDRATDIVGSVKGYIPFVGYVTILLSEYPWLKTAMLVFMGITVVLQRE